MYFGPAAVLMEEQYKRQPEATESNPDNYLGKEQTKTDMGFGRDL